MLVQFKIKNFLSIKDEQVFSMVADSAIKEKDMDDTNGVFDVSDNLSLLKSAVIYGANASGKSNFIRTFFTYQAMIVHSANLTELQEIGVIVPFLLNSKTVDKPSVFEAVFIYDTVQYRYGFEVSKKGITEEWLFVKAQRETQVFYRDKNGIEINPKYKILIEIRDKKMLHNKSLLVSKGAVFNDEISTNILKWANTIFAASGVSSGAFNYDTTISMLQDPKGKTAVVELMKLADFGITDLIVEEKEGSSMGVTFGLNAAGSSIQPEVKHEKTMLKEVKARRNVLNEKGQIVGMANFVFLQNESEGTKQFFSLIGPFLQALKNGSVMVVDEIDIKLHPLLSQRLVSLFNSKETNPKGAQLIFTTHDTNLLDAHIFRRDQVWFAEKDKYGASTIYPLTDYKPRNDMNLEKNYIAGKFGAIPYLGDFDLLIKEVLTHKRAKK